MIKRISHDDISECANVIRTSFLTVAAEFGFTETNAQRFTAFSVTKERLEWQLNNEPRHMYGYYENNRIVGYYSLLYQNNKECELNNLCVLPEYRHNKLGESLLENAFENARKMDCNRINIGIVEENTVLRNWYESFGFLHTGTKKYDFFPFTCGYMVKAL